MNMQGKWNYKKRDHSILRDNNAHKYLASAYSRCVGYCTGPMR